MREQAAILKYDADGALMRWNKTPCIAIRPDIAIENDAPLRSPFKPRDNAEQGALTATTGTEQGGGTR